MFRLSLQEAPTVFLGQYDGNSVINVNIKPEMN